MSDTPRPGWTVTRFFDLLPKLGRLRVISVCGPSVFEAICEAGAYSVEGGSLDMVTPAFHWHVAHERLRFVRSHDTEHERSGRRVLFFALRESEDAPPFLRIYVYRPPNEPFDPAVLDAFLAAHAEIGEGAAITPGVD